MQVSVVVVYGLRSCSSQAPEHWLNSCGTQAQLPCSLQHLPGPGIELVSHALQGGFLTTGPSGKPKYLFIYLAVLGLSCGTQDLHGTHVWDLLFQCPDSLVVACVLCWSPICRILVPQPRIKPTFPALQGIFLIHGPPRKSPVSFLKMTFFFFFSRNFFTEVSYSQWTYQIFSQQACICICFFVPKKYLLKLETLKSKTFDMLMEFK